MQRGRKRKNPQHSNPDDPPTCTSSFTQPYPLHQRPTEDECVAVRDLLLALHGFPEEFVKYRKQRQKLGLGLDYSDGLVGEEVATQRLEEDGGLDKELTVLDGLVSIVLSQNTTEANSQKAFASLKSAFPLWEDVLSAESRLIENAIRCGGLAPTKAACIKNLLTRLKERKGKLCLEYLRKLSVEEIKTELTSFKGIGPKTVACVLMFHLQKDDFPVDTHIFQIARTLGWVPMAADVKKTYIHLNRRIQDGLKFDLNCLLYTHGKMCNSCSIKKGKKQGTKEAEKPCPLMIYSDDKS